jgi:hypothetical protein
MDVRSLVLVPSFKTSCGFGNGLAVCPELGLLVTSDSDLPGLSVFTFSRCGGGMGALVPKYRLGGPDIKFGGGPRGTSGYLAFVGAGGLLLVTDVGQDSVHVFDVVGGRHAGYVGGRWSITAPRGVAVKGGKVVVSCWRERSITGGTLRLFEGAGVDWVPLWTMTEALNGGMRCPYGLRFTADGSRVLVADPGAGCVKVFRVSDGSFVQDLLNTGLEEPWDVEECEDGWIVAHAYGCPRVEFLGVGGDRVILGERGSSGGLFFERPTSLALVPGLGLVVREGFGSRVQLLAAPDAIAMAAMSVARVGWMAVCCRAILGK